MALKRRQEWVGERYFPERHIVLVSVELEGRADYALEPLKLLAERGVRMLSCTTQAHPDRHLVHATIFLDLTESTASPSELTRELSRIPHVKRIELIDIPLTQGEARLVSFTLAEMHHLLGMLRELGTGGEAIMYHMGFRAGAALADKLVSCYETGRQALEYLLLYYESLGRGRFKIREYEEGVKCRVEARELIECVGVVSDKPTSHMFRGLLAGFLSKLWGRDVKVVETTCIAMGDPYCEFLAQPR